MVVAEGQRVRDIISGEEFVVRSVGDMVLVASDDGDEMFRYYPDCLDVVRPDCLSPRDITRRES